MLVALPCEEALIRTRSGIAAMQLRRITCGSSSSGSADLALRARRVAIQKSFECVECVLAECAIECSDVAKAWLRDEQRSGPHVLNARWLSSSDCAQRRDRTIGIECGGRSAAAVRHQGTLRTHIRRSGGSGAACRNHG